MKGILPDYQSDKNPVLAKNENEICTGKVLDLGSYIQLAQIQLKNLAQKVMCL